jgi:hypothetical protein
VCVCVCVCVLARACVPDPHSPTSRPLGRSAPPARALTACASFEMGVSVGHSRNCSRDAALVTRVMGKMTTATVSGHVSTLRRSRCRQVSHRCCQLTSSGPGAGCTWAGGAGRWRGGGAAISAASGGAAQNRAAERQGNRQSAVGRLEFRGGAFPGGRCSVGCGD